MRASEQYARDSQRFRILTNLKPAAVPDLGTSTIRAYYQARFECGGAGILVNEHRGRVAGRDAADRRPASDLGTGRFSSAQKCLLHRGMIGVEGACPMWRGLDEIAASDERGTTIVCPPSDINRPAGLQSIVDTQLACLRYSPRMHAFAPDAVAKLALPFQHDNTCPMVRH